MKKERIEALQEGFGAFQEIEAKAKMLYGQDVTVRGLIIGNDYEIVIHDHIMHKGTSQEVRLALEMAVRS